MIDRHRVLLALWFRRLVTAILLVPTPWLLAFGSLVVRARIVVGEWPHPRGGNSFDGTEVDTPIDPKAFGWHHELVWLGVGPTFWALVVGVTLMIAGGFWAEIRAHRVARWVFAGTCPSCVVMALLFGEWLLD